MEREINLLTQKHDTRKEVDQELTRMAKIIALLAIIAFAFLAHGIASDWNIAWAVPLIVIVLVVLFWSGMLGIVGVHRDVSVVVPRSPSEIAEMVKRRDEAFANLRTNMDLLAKTLNEQPLTLPSVPNSIVASISWWRVVDTNALSDPNGERSLWRGCRAEADITCRVGNRVLTRTVKASPLQGNIDPSVFATWLHPAKKNAYDVVAVEFAKMQRELGVVFPTCKP